MSRIRVLVGTAKGAFILEADGARQNWKVSGPHFAGWEMYHLKGSPVEPNRLYASWRRPGSRGVDRGQVEDFSIADAGDAGYVGTYGTSITS